MAPQREQRARKIATVMTVMDWYKAGHFKTEEEARGGKHVGDPTPRSPGDGPIHRSFCQGPTTYATSGSSKLRGSW